MINSSVEAVNPTEARHLLGKTIRNTVLMLFLLPAMAFGLSSENFDGLTAQIVSSTTYFDNDSTVDWTFTQETAAQIAIAGNANGGTFTNGLSSDYVADRIIFLNYNGITSDNRTFGFHSTDGTHFALLSFELGNNLAGYSTSVTIRVLSGSTTVGSATIDLNTSTTSNGITYSYGGDSSGGSARPYGTLTFGAGYTDVTEVELVYSSAATPIIDNILITDPTYTVTYNGNSNTSGTVPAAQSKTIDVDVALATNTGGLDRTGYTFNGWNTATDGSGTHYDEGGTYTANASVALYAEWVLTAPVPASIPTLSEWGMIIMSILLGITAVVYIRRQRVKL